MEARWRGCPAHLVPINPRACFTSLAGTWSWEQPSAPWVALSMGLSSQALLTGCRALWGPPWLPSRLPPLGDRIPGQIRNQRRQTQKPGLSFISSLSQSVKGFHKFCSSAAAEETWEEEDSFVPQKTESSGISSPFPPPPTQPGTSPTPHVAPGSA